ncbi:MAG: HD domain-containing protein [Saprospiraceae bacterium]|nr:HD domain-containing protein [Saprospiraceae bacterium]MBK8511245.1 HD domain-containing protein [Saprospiraceae bacterium]MBK9677932.1 HD domain-containing protein [Saprospiraceae bacterium]MBK9929879.1 HD domain-containing protein [Saprospiraceae bacterium]MBP7801396.1 HD domain-containing protein [Saprospiraceae bacterium]
MNKRKIINDPVYGFTTIPDELIYDLIQHPYFQRLRRIRQLGLTDYVYPGATHSRFQHALGALHLMTIAIDSLRSKGVEITEKEAQGAMIAILLHDIGHSPYSHALEKKIIPLKHETLSLMFMKELNDEFDGKLSEAIKIFSNKHPKRFLSQLVSSQLDVDRMDYLNRDSFFTGVAEGVIGYERIIKMLSVVDNQIVVEEKGIYSIEKFLQSRRIMYWQVYLHKTVLAAEKMLIHWFGLLLQDPMRDKALPNLKKILSNDPKIKERKKLLKLYANIDDTDIISALKFSLNSRNSNIQVLANGLLNRNLFKCQLSDHSFSKSFIRNCKKKSEYPDLVFIGRESNEGYTIDANEIMILLKDSNKSLVSLSKTSQFNIKSGLEIKHYIIYY